MIFRIVSKFGVVLKDSIRATDDCGIPHMATSSLWEIPNVLRYLIIVLIIEDNTSTSSIVFQPSRSASFTYSLSFQVFIFYPLPFGLNNRPAPHLFFQFPLWCLLGLFTELMQQDILIHRVCFGGDSPCPVIFPRIMLYCLQKSLTHRIYPTTSNFRA